MWKVGSPILGMKSFYFGDEILLFLTYEPIQNLRSKGERKTGDLTSSLSFMAKSLCSFQGQYISGIELLRDLFGIGWPMPKH